MNFSGFPLVTLSVDISQSDARLLLFADAPGDPTNACDVDCVFLLVRSFEAEGREFRTKIALVGDYCSSFPAKLFGENLAPPAYAN